MEMCYDGMLVMPSSFALMDEEEMCYVDGGATWSHTFKVGSKNWTITVSNVKQATVQVLNYAANICLIGSGICSVISSSGTLSVYGAASVISGVAGVGYSCAQLKKLIKVRKWSGSSGNF